MKGNIFTTHLIDVIYPPKLEEDYVFLVMDYTESDLKNVLKTAKSICFTEAHVKTMIYNILSAINFMHSANVLHRDLKPANILIDDKCQIKICDFGFSRTLTEQQTKPKIVRGGSDLSKSIDVSKYSSDLSKTFTEKFKSPKAKKRLDNALSFNN